MFDLDAAKSLAKAAANYNQQPQYLYQATSGEYLFGVKGTLEILREQFKYGKQYTLITIVYPDGLEPKG